MAGFRGAKSPAAAKQQIRVPISIPVARCHIETKPPLKLALAERVA
jgi:hypothetical protein